MLSLEALLIFPFRLQRCNVVELRTMTRPPALPSISAAADLAVPPRPSLRVPGELRILLALFRSPSLPSRRPVTAVAVPVVPAGEPAWDGLGAGWLRRCPGLVPVWAGHEAPIRDLRFKILG